jgi:hypothetical protein
LLINGPHSKIEFMVKLTEFLLLDTVLRAKSAAALYLKNPNGIIYPDYTNLSTQPALFIGPNR